MNAMPTAARPLIAMLGARWMVGAQAAAIAWDAPGGVAAFALSDGSLALARPRWEGGPVVRAHAGGGAEMVPASAPPPPATRIAVHQGACLALVVDPDGGFLSSGTDGQIARVQMDGVIDTLGRAPDSSSVPLASGPGGWRLCASGRTLVRLGTGSRTLELPNTVTALAVAPDGSRAAIGHAGGITLWAGGDKPRRLAAKGIHTDLAWSRDARQLASATRDGDVLLWDIGTGHARQIDEGRAMRRSLGMTADKAHLITSASGAVVCWNLAESQLVPCGIASKDAVLHIACHPRRILVAAGYANGTILICRPTSTEVLFVRGAGGGGIDALAWSPDGEALAFGTRGGEIGLAVLPDLLFRDGEVPAA